MRLLAAAVVIAGPAFADPEFATCLSSEMAARSLELRDAAPCAADPACAAAPLSFYADQVEMACFSEAVERCDADATPNACLLRLAESLDALTAERSDLVTPNRVDAAVDRLGGIRGRDIARSYEDFARRTGAETCEAPGRRRDLAVGLAEGRSAEAVCAAADAFRRYGDLAALDRRLTRVEGGVE